MRRELICVALTMGIILTSCGGSGLTKETSKNETTVQKVEANTTKTSEKTTVAASTAGQKETISMASAKTENKKLKVSFLYDSPIGDGGWIDSHDLGRKKLEALGNVETNYVDNIPESDGWNYLNKFAQEGANIVFACSFGYMQDCVDVAGKNPNTIFMHCAGYETADNMGNYFGRNYEGAYLAGMACGGMTKSNKLGYVAPFPIAEVLRNINAFALGAKAVNPDAKVQVVWINAWYDPTLASQAAESLISNGVDALFHYENSPAVVQTAAKHKVYACGQHSDASSYSEEYCLTSSVWNWDVLYKKVVDEVQNGTWKPDSLWWGMSDGLVDIAKLSPSIPDDLKKKIEDAKSKLKSGDVSGNPFYGEVVDQTGKTRIPAGTDASYDELMNMDYLVSNVEGEIPANAN